MDDHFILDAESRDDYDQHLSEQITLLAGRTSPATSRRQLSPAETHCRI
jgi:hypothetical protein